MWAGKTIMVARKRAKTKQEETYTDMNFKIKQMCVLLLNYDLGRRPNIKVGGEEK